MINRENNSEPPCVNYIGVRACQHVSIWSVDVDSVAARVTASLGRSVEGADTDGRRRASEHRNQRRKCLVSSLVSGVVIGNSTPEETSKLSVSHGRYVLVTSVGWMPARRCRAMCPCDISYNML